MTEFISLIYNIYRTQLLTVGVYSGEGEIHQEKNQERIWTVSLQKIRLEWQSYEKYTNNQGNAR